MGIKEAAQRREIINQMLSLSHELGQYIWSDDYTEEGFMSYEQRIANLRDSLVWDEE